MVILRSGVFGWKKETKCCEMKDNPIEPTRINEGNQKIDNNNIHEIDLEIVETNDGSSTIYHSGIGEHYHSHHGALKESKHVFLCSGLQYFLDKNTQQSGNTVDKVAILEVGFGTGLNYLLTADYCYKNNIVLHYTGIERFPLAEDLINKTGYSDFIEAELAKNFFLNYPFILRKDLTQKETEIFGNSFLEISVMDALEFQSDKTFDVLYFDAFSAIHQPEMWTKELLAHLGNFLNPGGVFITYAITGNLKRNLKSLGFQIEKVPGAPGKREMLRAISPL